VEFHFALDERVKDYIEARAQEKCAAKKMELQPGTCLVESGANQWLAGEESGASW